MYILYNICIEKNMYMCRESIICTNCHHMYTLPLWWNEREQLRKFSWLVEFIPCLFSKNKPHFQPIPAISSNFQPFPAISNHLQPLLIFQIFHIDVPTITGFFKAQHNSLAEDHNCVAASLPRRRGARGRPTIAWSPGCRTTDVPTPGATWDRRWKC